ncbi:hypothetical protein HOLDEFILI_02355 [Holdemania filiformis DSM 12042]|uniref:Uncharacterized protein n=1 Tax=Holdemania filiformis DSM 12042 TaxID=545696 RepID=B9Y950_9FIRM|nr:hypothetical protein HOLDEFILI_02355 [Holdemania filiformis DSM 12042]
MTQNGSVSLKFQVGTFFCILRISMRQRQKENEKCESKAI